MSDQAVDMTGMRAYIMHVHREHEAWDAVLRALAEGKPRQAVEVIGDYLNSGDAVDDEVITLWERAAARWDGMDA